MVPFGSFLGNFKGFKAILTPLHCSDHPEKKILTHRAIKWHSKQLLQNTLFDSGNPYPPNGYLEDPKWPPFAQKWPKFSETQIS